VDEKLTGRRGELLRLGLAARNWLLVQCVDNDTLMNWKFDATTRSPKEIVNHVAWALSAVCMHISDELGIELEKAKSSPQDETTESAVKYTYEIFKELLSKSADETLDRTSTLPPPARIREGSIETILRIMAGYHVIHHAGQVALLVSRAKNALSIS
jgi:uncharacterized damage-inducible protein DinB